MGKDDCAEVAQVVNGQGLRIMRLESTVKLMGRKYRDDEAARASVAEKRQRDDEDRAAWRAKISAEVAALKAADARAEEKLEVLLSVAEIAKDAIEMIGRPATAIRKAASAAFSLIRRFAIRTKPIVSWLATAAALAFTLWQYIKGRNGG